MFKTFVTLAALAVTFVSAQSPDCLNGCLSPAVQSSGCAVDDINCLCTSVNFLGSLAACLPTTCSIADLALSQTAVQSLCNDPNIQLTDPSSPSSSGGEDVVTVACSSASSGQQSCSTLFPSSTLSSVVRSSSVVSSRSSIATSSRPTSVIYTTVTCSRGNGQCGPTSTSKKPPNSGADKKHVAGLAVAGTLVLAVLLA